mgnify:CR=1 FL=1
MIHICHIDRELAAIHQITNTLVWNYYPGSESAPFSTAHLGAMYNWIDPADPTYQGRPA